MKVKKPQEDAAALAKAVGGDKGQEIVKEKVGWEFTLWHEA